MRKLVVQQWVTVDNIAAEVDTMILGANTYTQATGYRPNADDQGEYGEKLTTSPSSSPRRGWMTPPGAPFPPRP